MIRLNALDEGVRNQILDLVTRYPDEVGEAMNGRPMCEVCGVTIGGRPGAPDGLCSRHADIDDEWDGEEIPAVEGEDA